MPQRVRPPVPASTPVCHLLPTAVPNARAEPSGLVLESDLERVN
jgi:hypothetical protein